MRILVIAFMVACSSSSQDPVQDASPASDASSSKEASTTLDSSSSPSDAAKPSEGACAACTANDCLDELQACGASQPCVNDLVTFNDCLGAASADCGTQLAAGGSEQASLWACLSTKCASTCGTE